MKIYQKNLFLLSGSGRITLKNSQRDYFPLLKSQILGCRFLDLMGLGILNCYFESNLAVVESVAVGPSKV